MLLKKGLIQNMLSRLGMMHGVQHQKPDFNLHMATVNAFATQSEITADLI